MPAAKFVGAAYSAIAPVRSVLRELDTKVCHRLRSVTAGNAFTAWQRLLESCDSAALKAQLQDITEQYHRLNQQGRKLQCGFACFETKSAVGPDKPGG